MTAVVDVDTSNIALEDIDDSISEVIDIIEQRVGDLGASDFEATATGPSTISFTFSVVDVDTARRVFESGFLEFREPRRRVDGSLVCQRPDGSELDAQPSSVTEGVDNSGQKEAQCVGDAGLTGTVVWEAASALNAEGELKQLTGADLKPNTTQVVSGPGQCVPACVQLEFTNEGALLFEKISTRLINSPLGFFLDGELLGAPQVRAIISNGQTIVTGLTEQEAQLLSAQLNSGALPIPVYLLSIGPVP